MSSKITFEEYYKRLLEVTNTIVPISNYIGWNKSIRYKCLVCDNEWNVKEARSAIRGFGCPKCAKEKQKEVLVRLSKSRIKSEEQFRKELSEKQPNLIPNDIYKSDNTKYHCICKIHNCDVYTTPEKYLRRNQGCKFCSVERNKCAIRYTDESYKEKAYSLNDNIKIVSKYQNIKEKVHVKCKICNYEWNPIAETLVWNKPCGCPNCSGNAIKTPESFESELKITHPELKLLSPYIRANRKLHVLCTDCNRDFMVTPNKLQQGQHCPYCKISHGESVIRSILTNLSIEFEMQKRFDDLKGVGGRKLSYDFYLPTYNFLVEYQGEQHKKPVVFKGTNNKTSLLSFEKQQEHDRRKREYAKENNIELLEIWYWDFNNIEQILSEKIFSRAS